MSKGSTRTGIYTSSGWINRTRIFSTALLLASASAGIALAQTPAAATAPATPASGAHRHGKGLQELDVNKDKLISRDEAKGKPHLTKNFDAMDSNKDGQLSRDEIRAYRQAHRADRKGEGKGHSKP